MGTVPGRVIILVVAVLLPEHGRPQHRLGRGPAIQKEFGLTNTQLGLAFSVFGFLLISCRRRRGGCATNGEAGSG